MARWSFGYGSNMDVTALRAKKHVKVLGKLDEGTQANHIQLLFLKFLSLLGA